MGHFSDADELLEVLGDELRTVVADDAWPGVWIGFAGALDDGFHVAFLHFVADFPMDNEAATTVEERAEKVIGAADLEMTDIDVPVFVAAKRLDESGAFLGGLGR